MLIIGRESQPRFHDTVTPGSSARSTLTIDRDADNDQARGRIQPLRAPAPTFSSNYTTWKKWQEQILRKHRRATIVATIPLASYSKETAPSKTKVRVSRDSRLHSSFRSPERSIFSPLGSIVPDRISFISLPHLRDPAPFLVFLDLLLHPRALVSSLRRPSLSTLPLSFQAKLLSNTSF